MRKTLPVLALMLLAATIVAAEPAPRALPGTPFDDVGVRPVAATNDAVFAHLAQSLAAALADPEMRRIVHQEVARRFDGDANALYRDLANRKLADGSTFRGRLAARAAATAPGTLRNSAAGLRVIDAYAEALPKLQVAVPVRFDDWDAESYAPLVAYLPAGVEDTDLVEVPAYDAAGRLHWLDARVEPPMPVVVVSLNERVDDLGFIHAALEALPCEEPYAIEECDGGGGGGGGGGGTTTTCTARTHVYGDKEILYQIKVNNDHEPWPRGNPEIYASYAFGNGGGIKGKYYMSNVDDEGTWYTINGHLFYWQSYYGNVFVNSIWEEDGSSSATATFSFLGINFTVNIKDGDDQLGAAPVSFHDPQCGYYSTGDAEFKMRHTAP